jgi:Amidase
MTSRSSPLADMPRAEVAARVNKRARSPVELMQATLDRIAALAPKRHADDTVFAEEALAAAREAEAHLRAGRDHGPWHGMPMAVKDSDESARTSGSGRATIPRTSGSCSPWASWSAPPPLCKPRESESRSAGRCCRSWQR